MNMESNIWIKRTTLSIAVASALLSQALIAEEQNNTLETIVISGERTSALDIEISQDELEKMQANDLEDIFRKESEVNVGGGKGIAQKIYVRGLEDTLLNVEIDGAKQSGYLFHHQGRISVEPELLKQIDVQAGTGDATSGPGALGGSIRFITKDPEDLLRGDERFGTLLKGGYHSNNDGYKTSISLYGKLNDNWSALASFVQSAGDDYEDGDGNKQQETDYSQQVGFAKIVGDFENNQKLSLSYDRRIDDGDRLTRTNWVGSEKNPVIPQEALRETATLKYAINPLSNKLLAIETTAYYTDNNITQDGKWGKYQGGVKSYGFDIRNKSLLSTHSFIYGIDYRQDTASLHNHSDSSYATDEDKGDVYGVYLQSELLLADAWLLSLGARYDIYKLTDAVDQTFENKGFSPNASLIFTPIEDLKFQLGYAQAMRGVQIKETFVLDYYQNAEDRKEETAENVEFSIDYSINNIGLSASVYRSTISDVVTTMNIAPEAGSKTTLGNVGDLTTDGYNVAVNYHWQAFQTSLSYNHNIAKLNGSPVTDDMYGLGASTGDSINADLSYQAISSLELGWNGHFITRLTNVAEGEEEKVGYGVHDIYAHWLPLEGDDALKVTFSIKNLFDKQYKDHATYGEYTGFEYIQGSPEPGRDFRINLSWAL